MSWLLDILRWIAFCGEDEPSYDRLSSQDSHDRSSPSSSSSQTLPHDSAPNPSPFSSSSPQMQRSVQPQVIVNSSPLVSSSPLIPGAVQPQPSARPSPFSHPSSSSSSSKNYDLLKSSLSSPISLSKPSPSSPTSSSPQTQGAVQPQPSAKLSPLVSSSPQTQRAVQPLLSAKPSPFPAGSPQSQKAVQPQPSAKLSLLASSSPQTQRAVQPQPSAKPSPSTSTSPQTQIAVQPKPTAKPSPLTSSSLLMQGAVQSQPSAKTSPLTSVSSPLIQEAVQPQPSTKPSPLTSSSPLMQEAAQPQAAIKPSPLTSNKLLTQGAGQPLSSAKPSPSSSNSPVTQGAIQPPKPSPFSSNSPQIWRAVQPQPSAKPSPISHLSSSSSSSKSHDLLKASLSFPLTSSKPSPSCPTSTAPTSLKQNPSSASVTPPLLSRTFERYEIPKELEEQIKRDVVPKVLKMPLSPSTYADYFAALLYAEDFYIEKWSEFLLHGVTLELKRREEFETNRENKETNHKVLTDKKPFVAFDTDEIPERLPYLLSRDFVYAKRVGESSEPFKGILFRVVKSKWVLVDFGNDFHYWHSPSDKYDVSFSFNRVCLKRAHQAVSAAKDRSLLDFLFPDPAPNFSRLTSETNYIQINSAVSRILNHEGPQPYLIEGPLSVLPNQDPNSLAKLSATGEVIQEAILRIYLAIPNCRILICTPTNKSCDALMWSLREGIPTAELFRANAAFRDYELVPDYIIPQCLYEGECFTCPSLSELRSFKVISSTYMSSFRLHNAGIGVNHFTHIFLVDASSAVEPEVVVPLANFAGGNLVIVVTGLSRNSPSWVRSDIARKHGLKRSFFERLFQWEPYKSGNDALLFDDILVE